MRPLGRRLRASATITGWGRRPTAPPPSHVRPRAPFGRAVRARRGERRPRRDDRNTRGRPRPTTGTCRTRKAGTRRGGPRGPRGCIPGEPITPITERHPVRRHREPSGDRGRVRCRRRHARHRRARQRERSATGRLGRRRALRPGVKGGSSAGRETKRSSAATGRTSSGGVATRTRSPYGTQPAPASNASAASSPSRRGRPRRGRGGARARDGARRAARAAGRSAWARPGRRRGGGRA